MLVKKVMGAGGFGAASAVSSFGLSIPTHVYWAGQGALTDNYFFLPSFEAPTGYRDYPVYAIDISTGSPGTVTRVFDRSTNTSSIDYITSITRMVPLTLTTGEEATAGVFNYYGNGNKTGLFVASPVISSTRDQYMSTITNSTTYDTRNTLCSAGTWVAYYSHIFDSITAAQFRYNGGLGSNDIRLVTTKTKTGIATTNALALAIDSTATHAYLTRYNGSAYITEVYNLDNGSLLGSYTWASSPGSIQQSYYDSGNLYLASTTAAYILNVSTPASITLSSTVSYTSSNTPTLHNGRVYLPGLYNSCSYEVFNIATSSSEGVVPTPADDGYGYFHNDAHPAEVRGDYVFIWAWADGAYGGTHIFDVSDLNDITHVSTVAPAVRVEGVAVSSDGNTLYQLEYDLTQTTLTLAKYDVSIKSSPALLGRSVDLVANYSTLTYFVSKPVLKGNYLYASFKTGSTSTDKLISFDVSGNTPVVADDLNCPTTNSLGSNTLAYGDSVFVLGPNSIWDVNVSNPAAMSSAAYRAANQGSGGGAYTGLIDGDYFYVVRPANQFAGYPVYFVIYNLSGHTPGSSFTTVSFFQPSNVDTVNYSTPVVWAINKIGDEIFATVPTSNTEAPWMLRVDVSNVSSPTEVLANGAHYTYSGYSNKDAAMCFLLHPDNQTITSFARTGSAAATWNAVTGVATRPVIDVGTYGPSPVSFFSSTKHVTLSRSGAMTIGDI